MKGAKLPIHNSAEPSHGKEELARVVRLCEGIRPTWLHIQSPCFNRKADFERVQVLMWLKHWNWHQRHSLHNELDYNSAGEYGSQFLLWTFKILKLLYNIVEPWFKQLLNKKVNKYQSILIPRLNSCFKLHWPKHHKKQPTYNFYLLIL